MKAGGGQWLKHYSNNKVEENIQHAKNPIFMLILLTQRLYLKVGILKEGWRRCCLNFLRMSEFYSPNNSWIEFGIGMLI